MPHLATSSFKLCCPIMLDIWVRNNFHTRLCLAEACGLVCIQRCHNVLLIEALLCQQPCAVLTAAWVRDISLESVTHQVADVCWACRVCWPASIPCAHEA